MRSSKTCFKCKKSFPTTEFYSHKEMRDGLLGKCKECTKKSVSNNRKKNIEYYRAYDRERAKHPERIKAAIAQTKIWRQADSRRSACHNAVARALRSGIISKDKCAICGDSNSIAHHDSYDKPLNVVWLCQVHHKLRHKKMAIKGIEP